MKEWKGGCCAHLHGPSSSSGQLHDSSGQQGKAEICLDLQGDLLLLDEEPGRRCCLLPFLPAPGAGLTPRAAAALLLSRSNMQEGKSQERQRD